MAFRNPYLQSSLISNSKKEYLSILKFLSLDILLSNYIKNYFFFPMASVEYLF